jgi:hypothetical protein
MILKDLQNEGGEGLVRAETKNSARLRDAHRTQLRLRETKWE